VAGKEKEIKAKIKLEGEKEYSAALQTAQRNLKTLRSELKAETAELGANATAQEKNRLKAESLKKQIAEQEKIVETLRKQLAEAKRDYGDNEDVVQKYTQQLNYARATLGNMQGDLQRLSGEYRNVGNATNAGIVATKSFADSLASIGSVGDSISGSIEDIFTGMISTVVNAVEQLWDLVGDTASKANNWTDIAGYWGTDPATIERYARATEASANSFSDLESIVSRIVLGGKTDKITEMLGVSDVNYTNQWDYAMAVMDRISELTQSGNMPDNFWEEVFGEKKATKAMDLVNDWQTIQEGLQTFNADEGGLGVGTDSLEVLNDLWVKMSEITEMWTALKDSVVAGLAPIALDLSVNVTGAFKALNDFLKADTQEERDKALEDLRLNVEGFFKTLKEKLDEAIATLGEVGKSLQGSEDPIVKAIGNALVTIKDALSWFMDENNIEKVKAGIGAIFGIWLTAKLAAVAAKLTSIIAQINLIKTFSVGKGLLGALGGGGAAEAVGSAAGGAAGAGGGLFSGMFSGIKAAAMKWNASNAALAIPEVSAGVTSVGSALMAAAPLLMVGGAIALDKNEKAIYQSNTEEAEAYVDSITESITDLADNADAVDTAKLEAVGNLVQLLGEALSGQQDPAKEAAAIDALRNSGMTDVITDSQMQQLNEGTMDYEMTQTLWNILGQLETHYRTLNDPTTYANPIQPNTQDSETASVMRGAPKAIAQAVANAMSGFSVRMDGVTVGRLVAPYVSQQIARDMVY
jgi:hypothetical protein